MIEANMENKMINKANNIIPKSENAVETTEIADLFPVVELSESELNKAKKIPIASLAALGSAFSQMPEAARTIVKTTTSEIATNETLFVGINPKGIPGYLLQNEYGTVGNIMQINEQGKQVITGRMRFKPVDGLPISNTTTTVVPFDPTMMVVAVALMTIEKKLDAIQKSIDKVIRFLENDKQSRQRGNLNTLAEIAEDYRRKGNDQDFCQSRNHTVQEIQRDARHNIEFYKRKISEAVKDKKLIHLSKDAQAYMESIKKDFAEYQLACYSYAYCAFLDTVLRKDFDEASIDSCRNKINRIAGRYNELFDECHSQIASYQRSSVENKVLGGIGKTANTLGKAIGNIPVIEKSPVDELLLDAGNALGGVNKNAVKSRVKALEFLEDNRMNFFLEGVETVGALYNQKNRMLIDGTNLYVFESV